MIEKETEDGIVFAIPGSVTDLAKGLRELIACLRDIGNLIGDSGKLVTGGVRKRRTRGAARNLDILSFAPSGSRQFLERIAEGKGTEEDINGIEQALEATAADVENSLKNLKRYRGILREISGMKAAEKLDGIIFGRLGKNNLRHSLDEIIRIYRDEEAISTEIVQKATQTLNIIFDLNVRIEELHDLILSHSKM